MRQVNIHSEHLDFNNKMYIFIGKTTGVCLLKHFIFSPSFVTRWRWVNMDGRSFYNILIDERIPNGCLLHPTPLRAFSFKLLGEGVIYEFNGIVDFIKNAHTIIEQDEEFDNISASLV